MADQAAAREAPPDVFTDSIQVSVGAYGVILRCRLSDPDAETSVEQQATVATLRMSPQLAYVVGRILLRGLAQAGEQGLGYGVPADTLKAMGLANDATGKEGPA